MSEDFNADKTGLIVTIRCQNWLTQPLCMRFQAGYFDLRSETCDDMIRGAEKLGWQIDFHQGGVSIRALCPSCVQTAARSKKTLPSDGC